MKITKATFERAEIWVFLSLILVYLLPIWTLDYFPVLDAMGHVYNGDVLWSLITSNNSAYQGIFAINPNFSPNWISHPLLAILTRFFDPFTTEKIILSTYLVGFPLAFRYMIFSVTVVTRWMSLLGFVFVYSFTFINGFLNYNFGLIFLLLSIGLFNRLIQQSNNRRFVWLGFLLIALYFSHFITTFIFFIYVLSFLVVEAVRFFKTKKLPPWFSIRNAWKFSLAFLFPVMMSLIYVAGDVDSEVRYYWTAREIWHNFYYQTGYFCFGDHEWLYTRWNRNVVVGALIISVIAYVVAKQKGQRKWKHFLHLDLWGFVFTLFFVLVAICTFILPDASPGGGGLLTIRIVYLTTTFFLVAFFQLIRWRMLLIVMLLIVNIVSVDRLGYLYRRQRDMRQTFCRQLNEASDKVSENGILLMFDYREGDFLNHYSKVIATEHHLIALDNLGAHKYFSPIQWSGDLLKNEQVMCWLGHQWNCSLSHIPERWHDMDIYFLIHGSCDDHKYGATNCTEWQSYFENECELLYQGSDDVFLYRHLRNSTTR